MTVNTNNGSSGGDGIKTNSDEDGKGYVTINGGTVNIDSYADGIQAEQTFTMNGGELNITTYQGSNFTGSASGGNGGWGGGMGGNDGNSNKTDISAKGIKAVGVYDEAGTTWQSGGDLIVNGGTITIDSSDDSLHCGGDMQLLGGSMTLATADDGAHSDHALTIGSTGGDYDAPYVNITKSYEGIEGVDITQNSGTVMVTSSDDGYNAAGGADSSGNNNSGGWGQGSWGGPGGGSSSDGSQTMTFNGRLCLCECSRRRSGLQRQYLLQRRLCLCIPDRRRKRSAGLRRQQQLHHLFRRHGHCGRQQRYV